MTDYNRGDVVLVSFIFSDETGVKKRPALIISSKAYHDQRNETIILAITSRTDRVLAGDYLIKNWQVAGLLFPSVATGIIRTIKREIVLKKLGSVTSSDMRNIDAQLRVTLGLS